MLYSIMAGIGNGTTNHAIHLHPLAYHSGITIVYCSLFSPQFASKGIASFPRPWEGVNPHAPVAVVSRIAIKFRLTTDRQTDRRMDGWMYDVFVRRIMLICVVPNTMMKLLCPIPETGQIHRRSCVDGGGSCAGVSTGTDGTLTYCSIKLLEACIKCILFCYLMLLLS